MQQAAFRVQPRLKHRPHATLDLPTHDIDNSLRAEKTTFATFFAGITPSNGLDLIVICLIDRRHPKSTPLETDRKDHEAWSKGGVKLSVLDSDMFRTRRKAPSKHPKKDPYANFV